MLSDEEVDEAAATAVAAWMHEMAAAGYKSVAEVNQREQGLALKRSLAVFLNTYATDHYALEAEKLFQAGVRDQIDSRLSQDLNRINLVILRRLLARGFQVAELLSQYEAGTVPDYADFTFDNH